MKGYVILDPVMDYEESDTVVGIADSLRDAIEIGNRYHEVHSNREVEIQLWHDTRITHVWYRAGGEWSLQDPMPSHRGYIWDKEGSE